MNVYTGIHSYYCGIDLHARTMYVRILDSDGKKVYHKNIPCSPERFLQAIEPYRGDLVVGVECIFCWYWLADLCQAEGIDFVLGHALYMKAIHGVKTKNDRIDSLKIARLIRGSNFPDPVVQLIIQTDLKLIDHYDPIIKGMDKQILTLAKGHSPTDLHLLRSVPGVGEVLALTMLYEIHDISRHGKSKALSIVAKRLGIAVYYMLKRQQPFNLNMFLSGAKAKQKV